MARDLPSASESASVRGAELRFSASEVEIPLDEVSRRMKGNGTARLERPALSTPRVEGELELKPVRDLALREILSHAESGRATVRLPLPARSFKVGPFSAEIQDGTEAVIELCVHGATILREQTHGTLDPPIALPLGLSFRGLYLDESGAIIADIAGFPDINLSKLIDRVPYIPGTLEELLSVIFDGERGEGSSSGLDLSGLRVEARDVVPRAEVFHLGNAGELLVGPETRLDVDFARDELSLRGRVEIVDATLEGAGFQVRGLSGTGTLSWSLSGLSGERAMRLDAHCFQAHIEGARLSLRDGTTVELGPADVESAKVELLRKDGQLPFRVELGRVRGALEHALVLARVGAELVPVEVGSAEVEGSASLSERHLEANLDVSGVEVEVPGVHLDLGIAALDVRDVRARAEGRVKAGTDYGFAFSGHLEASALVTGGSASLGSLEAHLAEESRATLVLREIAAGPEGLDVLVGSGEVRLQLASGSLPLGPEARVSFSRGARGTLTLAEIERQPGRRWPLLRGGLHVEAESDPVDIASMVRLPSGRAALDAALSLDEGGRLLLQGLDMRLVTTDDG